MFDPWLHDESCNNDSAVKLPEQMQSDPRREGKRNVLGGKSK